MQELKCRRRTQFDSEWLFFKADAADGQRTDLDDAGWRRVDLPHDWSIEGPWAENNPSGRNGGFAPLGLGWYRKHYYLPNEHHGKRIHVEFDGVFNRADVWVNGEKVAHNENGYIGFECDLTPWVKFGQDNVIAVRADNLMQVSRWYTGSGIYRHVWLTVTEPLHVAHWGTYIATPEVTDSSAQAKVQTTLQNDTDDVKSCILVTRLVDPNGQGGGVTESKVEVPAQGKATFTQVISIAQPRPWTLESPRLYRAISEVREGKRTVDIYETPFGIRTIEFDANNGLLLNGKRVIIKGANIHHDLGALGAASFDCAIERRLKVLKEIGCNSVRLSHNPHSPELLDLCDRMGILVFAEAFDKWSGFQPDGTGWKNDLNTFILRDRNHPSVFIWSVGNEMRPHQAKHEGTLLYRAMQNFVHDLEPTRPVTAALERTRTTRERLGEYAPLHELAQDMDVITMNYQPHWYARDHAQFPDKVFLGGEVFLTLAGVTDYDHVKDITQIRDPKDVRNMWFGTRDYSTNEYRSYVAGQYVWAGIDYFGEGGFWPRKGNFKNLVDTCGFRRAYSYYFQTLYSDEPQVWISVHDPEFNLPQNKRGAQGWMGQGMHWTWPSRLQTLKVLTFTNAPIVELLLNGKSLGEKRLVDFADRIIIWDVPNEPGTLKAIARKEGAVVATHELRTASEPVRLQLLPDRSQLDTGGQDLAHVEVRVVDATGLLVPHLRQEVDFRISGPGFIAGLDNGDLDSLEPYQSKKRELRDSHCLAIVRSGQMPGKIRLVAHAEGLEEGTLEIEVQPCAAQV